MRRAFYGTDLAYVHDAGFGEFAVRVAPELVRLLRRRGITSGRVVELGCGAGTVARHLSEAGYDVLGIDISAAMIRLARQRAPRASFRVGSLAAVRLPPCRAIIAVGEVIAYLVPEANGRDMAPREAKQTPTIRSREQARTHEQRLMAFLARAYRALPPGGLLLFDFMASAAGRTYPRKRLPGDGWAIEVSAAVDATGRTLTRRMRTFRQTTRGIRTSDEVHRVRIYPRARIRTLLSDAGFDVQFGPSIGRVRLMRSDVAVVAKRR